MNKIKPGMLIYLNGKNLATASSKNNNQNLFLMEPDDPYAGVMEDLKNLLGVTPLMRMKTYKGWFLCTNILIAETQELVEFLTKDGHMLVPATAVMDFK